VTTFKAKSGPVLCMAIQGTQCRHCFAFSIAPARAMQLAEGFCLFSWARLLGLVSLPFLLNRDALDGSNHP